MAAAPIYVRVVPGREGRNKMAAVWRSSGGSGFPVYVV